MFANERQKKICEIICEKGAITTSEIAERFGVSGETARKDILLLSEGGYLKRVHGGAVSLSRFRPYTGLSARNEENTDLKRELSKYACRFISEGDVIAIDCGSTAVIFAGIIKDRYKNLTVITHSADVFDIVKHSESIKTVLCGGVYDGEERAFFGTLAEDAVKNLHANKAFIFPAAFSLEGGISDYKENSVQLQRALMSISDEVYFLADSSKFEKNAIFKTMYPDERCTFVTDSGIGTELVKIYLENGIRIACAGGEE